MSTSIPIYSQFTINGITLFNRNAITIPAGQSVLAGVTLYEGYIVSYSFQGTGVDFQVYISPETGFVISDSDVEVIVNSQAIRVITDGLWNYSGANGNAVADQTDPSGALILQFGSSLFGYSPQLTDTITIQYIITKGFLGNNYNANGLKFTYVNDATVTATTTSVLTNGYDEINAQIYKATSSAYFGSINGAVTRSQYNTIPLQYPGVKDALVKVQRDINPGDIRYMNLCVITLLTDPALPAWNQAQWNAFAAWFQAKTMYSTVPVQGFATPIANTVVVNVYVPATSDPVSVQTNLTTALNALFYPKFQTLNTNLYISDLTETIKDVQPDVRFVAVPSPTADMIVNILPPILTISSSSSGGSLVAGTYAYSVSAVFQNGETGGAVQLFTIISGTTNEVILNWTAVPGVIAYKVFGRSSIGIGVIATVSSSTLTFTDVGSLASNNIPPQTGSTVVQYNTLASLTVNVLFTDRGF